MSSSSQHDELAAMAAAWSGVSPSSLLASFTAASFLQQGRYAGASIRNDRERKMWCALHLAASFLQLAPSQVCYHCGTP